MGLWNSDADSLQPRAISRISANYALIQVKQKRFDYDFNFDCFTAWFVFVDIKVFMATWRVVSVLSTLIKLALLAFRSSTLPCFATDSQITLKYFTDFILFLPLDGGEGHVGTLCEVGRSGSTHSPEKTVVVNWDSGHRTNYRVGYQSQYDLIVIDNAQIGVRHQNIICDGCKKAGIAGILFRCAECANFDLCAHCYGNDVHYLEHSFVRYQTANSVGWVHPA